jgi:hypothetical protein
VFTLDAAEAATCFTVVMSVAADAQHAHLQLCHHAGQNSRSNKLLVIPNTGSACCCANMASSYMRMHIYATTRHPTQEASRCSTSLKQHERLLIAYAALQPPALPTTCQVCHLTQHGAAAVHAACPVTFCLAIHVVLNAPVVMIGVARSSFSVARMDGRRPLRTWRAQVWHK